MDARKGDSRGNLYAFLETVDSTGDAMKIAQQTLMLQYLQADVTTVPKLPVVREMKRILPPLVCMRTS